MTPQLYQHFGRKKINSFHFYGVLGYLLGTLLGVLIAFPLGLRPEIMLLMALAAAATFFLLAYAAKSITGAENIVYYHHEIAILVVCSGLLSAFGLPVLPYLEVVLLGIGLFLALGRIGCHSVGCCHGLPHKHGVTYNEAHVNAGFTWFYKDVSLLPVQLIESVYVFLTVGAGVLLLLSHAVPGTVLIVYTVVYGLFRFVLEFFRGDPERPIRLGLSEAQWTTLALNGLVLWCSCMGWLPLYSWHLVISGLLLLAALAVITRSIVFPSSTLFQPLDLEELATGLRVLEQMNGASRHITTYTTRRGVCVSAGTCIADDMPCIHYTISFKAPLRPRQTTVSRIARQIGILQQHRNGYRINARPNNIYHILFPQHAAQLEVEPGDKK